MKHNPLVFHGPKKKTITIEQLNSNPVVLTTYGLMSTTKKGESKYTYARTCSASLGRQPIAITESELQKIKDDSEFAVIEMGANHIGEIEFLSDLVQPDYGYITNFGKAHLEGFKNIESIAKAKAEIYTGLQSSGIAVINADDAYADFWKNSCKKIKQVTFGIESESADIRAKNIKLSANKLFIVSILKTVINKKLTFPTFIFFFNNFI